MNDQAKDLDEVFARIEEEEAKAGKAGSGSQDVVQAIADSDGLVLVEELIRDGHTKPAIAAALLPPGSDGRSKPRAKAGVIDGQRLLWLTSSGWASVGQQNRREAPPTSSRVQHRRSSRDSHLGLITRSHRRQSVPAFSGTQLSGTSHESSWKHTSKLRGACRD